MTQESLLPCLWCGRPLSIRGGVNAYGRCDTEDCWMHERALTVPLSDPRQVAQWNTRVSTNKDETIAELREALRMAIVAGRNLRTEMEAGFDEADYEFEAEDQAIVDGAVADLDECERTLAAFTSTKKEG